jgi:hypothetical protein
MDGEKEAMERLLWVMKAGEARALIAAVKSSIGLNDLGSTADLQAFGEALHRRGGEAAWIGALLVLLCEQNDQVQPGAGG